MQETHKSSECLPTGEWQPDIPECLGDVFKMSHKLLKCVAVVFVITEIIFLV